MHQQRARTAKGPRRAANVGWREQGVGARGDGDAVLTIGGNKNQGDAGRALPVARHVPRMNALPGKALDGPLSEHISAQARDQGYVPARAGRGHRLVGTLAACGRGELAAQHRFTWMRDARHIDDHVRIRTADDEDFRFHACARIHPPVLHSEAVVSTHL